MKGSISVFACLILATVMLLNCVLIDTAKIVSIKTGLAARTALSSESILAGFDTLLREHYRLFAIDGSKNVKEEFISYFEVKDRSYGSSSHLINVPEEFLPLDMQEYDLDNVIVELKDSLVDPRVLERQIYEEMKIRTPLNLGKSILDKFKILSRSDNMSDSFQKEAEITSMMNEVSKNIEELTKYVEGAYPGDIGCVNGYDRYMRHLSYVSILKSGIDIIKAGSSDTEAFEKGISDMKDAVLKIKAQASIYLDYNVNAIGQLQVLENLQVKAMNKIKEMDDWLNKYNPEDELEIYYKQVITQKKNALHRKVINMGNKHLLEPLNSNAGTLSRIMGAVDNLVRILDMPEDLILTVSEFEGYISNLDDKGIKTNLKVYTGNKGFDSTFNKYDQRKVAETDLRSILKEYKAVVIPPETYRTLPSVVRDIDPNSLEGKMLSQTDSQLTLNSVGIIMNIMSIKDEFKNFKEDPLDYLSKGVLIDDYIMTYFGSSVKDISTRKSYFKSEIEYIIGGTSYESTNRLICESLIFSIRFLMNIIHIMCDSDKVDLANKIGNAIAGSITCGIGGPLYATLVIAGWSICESVIDIKHLLEGKNVPFLKRKSEWNFQIEGLPTSILEEDFESNSFFRMGYNDYLRILLVLVGRDTKLLRICDLIELNMTSFLNRRYSLSPMYTGVKVSVIVRMDTLLSYTLLPGLKREEDDFVILEVYYGSY